MMKSVRNISITSSPRTRRAIHPGLRPRPPDRGFGVQTASATGSPGATYFGAETGQWTDLACTRSMRREHARAAHRAPTGTESPAIVICANQLSSHSHSRGVDFSYHLRNGPRECHKPFLPPYSPAPPVCSPYLYPSGTYVADRSIVAHTMELSTLCR
jgi:hypothetical protein